MADEFDLYGGLDTTPDLNKLAVPSASYTSANVGAAASLPSSYLPAPSVSAAMTIAPGFAQIASIGGSSYRSEPPPTSTAQNALYLREMDWWTTDRQIRELCAPFGRVCSIQFVVEKSGKSRGIATVIFEDDSGAEKACKAWESIDFCPQFSGRPLIATVEMQNNLPAVKREAGSGGNEQRDNGGRGPRGRQQGGPGGRGGHRGQYNQGRQYNQPRGNDDDDGGRSPFRHSEQDDRRDGGDERDPRMDEDQVDYPAGDDTRGGNQRRDDDYSTARRDDNRRGGDDRQEDRRGGSYGRPEGRRFDDRREDRREERRDDRRHGRGGGGGRGGHDRRDDRRGGRDDRRDHRDYSDRRDYGEDDRRNFKKRDRDSEDDPEMQPGDAQRSQF